MTAYSAETRARARALWLRGGLTDEAVAAEVGVTRGDTIRDWRKSEGWEELRRAVDAAAEFRIGIERREAQSKIDTRHDQIGEALEALVIRAMRTGGNPRPGELRALASAALAAQKLRRVANRMDDETDGKAEARPQVPVRRVVFQVAKPPEGWKASTMTTAPAGTATGGTRPAPAT